MSTKRERQRAARRRRKAERSETRAVYHGTAEGTIRFRRVETGAGLLPDDNGVRSFVTIDKERAAGYAVRSVCHELAAAGNVERPELAPAAVLLTMRVPADWLEADGANTLDFLLPRSGVPTSMIEVARFDPRPWLPDAAGIREYARLTALSREMEAISRRHLHTLEAA